MFKKFHWGTGIFLFMALFVISMGVVVVLSFNQNNELVEEEYYPLGIEYQQQIDRIANARTLSGIIEITQLNDSLIITYPNEFSAGQFSEGLIRFYRPSDEQADIKSPMLPDSSGVQRLSVLPFLAGKYTVKFNWNMDGKQYYSEQSVMIRK